MVQHSADELANFRLLRGPRAGHVQPPDLVRVQELLQCSGGSRRRAKRSTACVRVQVERRLAEPTRKFQRERRAADDLRGDRKEHGSVTIAHVPLGPLRILAGRSLLEPVLRRDGAVFSKPAPRAPTPMRKVVFDGEVERRAIGARLTARDDRDARYVVHRQILGNRTWMVHNSAVKNYPHGSQLTIDSAPTKCDSAA